MARVGLLWKESITGKVPRPQRASMQSSDFTYIARGDSREQVGESIFLKINFGESGPR